MLKIQKTFKNNLPTIFLVTTPIGNLEDFSKRSEATLKSVDVIFCEDTRTSSVLLNKYSISTKTRSLHKYNESERVNEISEYLINGKNIAIISDAGVPGINDPGMKLIYEISEDIQFNVSAIGAGTAYIHNIICSRLLFDKNFYYGFLPKKDSEINQAFSFFLALSNLQKGISISFYESVHRIRKTLEKIRDFFCDEKVIIVIGREITKINEEYSKFTLDEIDIYLQSYLIEKGEFCISLFIDSNKIKKIVDEEFLINKINELTLKGVRKKEALKILELEYDFNLKNLFKKV